MGVETKVAAGSVTAIVSGLLTWALVAFIPAFKNGLPPELAKFLPIAVAWALSTAAAYAAPHTPRTVPPIPGIRPPDPPSGAVTVKPQGTP